MNRQPGYYHIKHDGEWFIAKWEQCECDSQNGCIKGVHQWHYTYGGEIIITDVVDEINETRIPSPDEEIDLRDDIYIPDQYEEAFKKRLRSIADHCEFGLEFKNEVNGKYFDVDTDLLDKI